jgi:4-hydroxy-tetrahydrodipicolinate synthase
MAAEAGADGSLVVAPYYNKPNEAGLRAHFETVAAAVPEQPLIIYNIPSRVIVNVPVELLAELAAVDNIVAVKQANDDELGPIDGLSVLAGNDTTFLPVLEFGGAGGILVASHVVGEQMREMWDAAQTGDLDRARAVDSELREVYAAMGVTTNPMPVKGALAMMGVCDERMRLPMVPLNDEHRAVVRAALEGVGVPAAH